MKSIKSIATALLFGAVLSLAACGSGSEHSHEHGTEASMEGHGDDARFTSAYVCPMHCEGSGSAEEGKCPVCGMAYITKADHDKKSHSH